MREYRLAEQVRWAVEVGGVVIINNDTGAATSLNYPQAAIWDFLNRGESNDRICAMLCPIASLDLAAAHALVLETVSALREAGLLAPGESGG